MRNVKTGHIMGVACLEFRGENFRGWRENREIRESFLPRKFPALRYHEKFLVLEEHPMHTIHHCSAVNSKRFVYLAEFIACS